MPPASRWPPVRLQGPTKKAPRDCSNRGANRRARAGGQKRRATYQTRPAPDCSAWRRNAGRRMASDEQGRELRPPRRQGLIDGGLAFRLRCDDGRFNHSNRRSRGQIRIFRYVNVEPRGSVTAVTAVGNGLCSTACLHDEHPDVRQFLQRTSDRRSQRATTSGRTYRDCRCVVDRVFAWALNSEPPSLSP
jgi:hypothetical protein